MGLRFVLGRAGTGKTRHCLSRLVESSRGEGPAAILLVPDQATFQLEHQLGLELARGATVRAFVASFRRLGHRVLDAAGGSPHPGIGTVGKLVAVRTVLDRRRGDLRYFTGPIRPGTAAWVASQLAGFAQAGIDAHRLLSLALAAEEDGSPLAARLFDLALVAGDMAELLAGRRSDPDHLLAAARERAALCPFLPGARIWVDGFSGFTPEEFGILGALLRMADSVEVCLCLDPDLVGRPPAEGSLFWPCHRTMVRLEAMARELSVPVLPPLRLDRACRFASATLARIEAEAPDWRQGAGDGSLVVRMAGSPRAEVEAAAEWIVGLVRDRGLAWRQIAVLVRDIGTYADIVREAFSDHGIPAFIDQRWPVRHHPLIRFVRAAVETAADGDHGAFVRWLRAGLVKLSPDVIDRLENDAIAGGFRAGWWLDGTRVGELSRRYRNLSVRETWAVRQAARPLARLCRLLSHRPTMTGALAGIYAMLDEVRASEILEQWRQRADRGGDPGAASEHRQAWTALVELAEELVAAAAALRVSARGLLSLLDVGLRDLRVGVIPPALDQVVVGSVARSRQPPVAAALVLGCDDGSFAAEAQDALDDEDRQWLEDRFGLEVGLSARERAFAEPFLGYVALTRASDLLYLSWAAADSEGRPRQPSPLVTRLVQAFGVRPAVADGPGDRTAAIRGVLSRLRQGTVSGPWLGIRDWCERRARVDPRLAELLRATRETGDPGRLEPGLCRVKDGRLEIGVTALERFGRCPFSFFAAHTLRLKRRREYAFRAYDRGDLLHTCLAAAIPAAAAAVDPDPGEIVDRALADAVSDPDHVLLSSARGWAELAAIRGILVRCLLFSLGWWGQSRFRPWLVEWSFSDQDVGLDLGDGLRMSVRGRVDRIDACADPAAVLVLDYKTGAGNLSPDMVAHGLSLQLPTYLGRALSLAGPGTRAAGVAVMRIHDPVIRHHRWPPPEEAAAEVSRRLRPRGLFGPDLDIVRALGARVEGSEFSPIAVKQDQTPRKGSVTERSSDLEALARAASAVMAGFGRRILAGDIAIAPADWNGRRACLYCDMRPVCGFDRLLPAHRPRRLQAGDGWSNVRELAGEEP